VAGRPRLIAIEYLTHTDLQNCHDGHNVSAGETSTSVRRTELSVANQGP
jgi:hypothetical protein